MDVSFRFRRGDSSQTITSNKLSEYAELWGLNEFAPGRYSWLFVFDLFKYMHLHGINPLQVLDEIRVLEGALSRGTQTKPASQFRRSPLKGLWHKHYFSARFMAHNMLNQLGRDGISSAVNEICDASKSPALTEEMVKELAHRVTIEQYEKRAQKNELTGEWIVFAKHEGENFYLCLATHSTDDNEIYSAIQKVCWPQFPFLAKEA